MNHKCDGCRFKGEHQEMGFRPFGVCTKEPHLGYAVSAFNAEVCPYKKKDQMTEAEIMMALECCVSDGCTCTECPYEYTKHIVNEEFEIMPNGKSYDDLSCDEWLKADLFDLINRKNAEIERLTINMNAFCLGMKRENEIADTARAEAIKEFAERVKAKHRRITDYDEAGFGCQIFIVEENIIDQIAKEMAGDTDV